jgi:hypothetical protein
MTHPRWSDKLARPIRDAVADVTLRTRHDARRYIEKLPKERGQSLHWHVAAKLLLEGADAEEVTQAIELALRYEGRLDTGGWN